MLSFNVLSLCLLTCFLSYVECNRERKIQEILESVRRIEDHISKEDRLREIADIVRIDANVDKLSMKVDMLLNMLDHSPIPPTGRSESGSGGGIVPRDLGSNMQAIQNRLQNLESSVAKVEESIGELGVYSAKVNEIEQRTTQLKDDMNVKLRKMMNVLTALYEMNKEMKKDVESRSEDSEKPKADSGSSGYAAEFFMENLDELERKLREQFSVLASEIRAEVTSLKVVAASSSNCPTADEDEDDEWMTPQNSARSTRGGQAGRSVGILDNLVETVGRSTREIKEEIQNNMQEIDTKLQNLTALAQNQPKCSDLDASASAMSRRRSLQLDPVHHQILDPKSKPVEKCTKIPQNVPNPKSCADLRRGGATCDGVYVIFPRGRRAVRVLCDMSTNEGGWTVLMRRGDYGGQMTSFHRNWLSYKNGFGDADGEFWIGNDVMNYLTSEDPNVLRIQLSSFDDEQIDLEYDYFAVGNESTKYQIQLGMPIMGPEIAANSFRYHNQQPFSTFDRKNENFQQNCAATYKGGWWFKGCYFCFLTGEYFRQEDKRENWQGMLWYDWKGNAPLKAAIMMIRPKNFALVL